MYSEGIQGIKQNTILGYGVLGSRTTTTTRLVTTGELINSELFCVIIYWWKLTAREVPYRYKTTKNQATGSSGSTWGVLRSIFDLQVSTVSVVPCREFY